ncbi:hypothetical protein F5J12DRAFT_817002 [Pisolithus orientalis]|uniref:uncharacterized protein n=1 Tax=Pisolithus orientalis TaxID=936130 RepID=UPI002223F9E5|nr:uncharacterized protein F5J12DRAFT_817002 [Pisolithus orientalis]KAI6015267.1 hypothetical protein F5J12DRAFT_817002 [Pisolithus orientalis]
MSGNPADGSSSSALPHMETGAAKEQALREFSQYPFTSDEVFQHGLIQILAHSSTQSTSEEERSELALKTQLFYFNRQTGRNLTLEDVKRFPLATSDLHPSVDQSVELLETQPLDKSPRILSFAELKDLIESGNTEKIPHNKHIPDQLNDCIPSLSNASVRKKPWEAARSPVQ